MGFIKQQLQRQLKLEAGEASNVTDSDAADMTTAGRAYPRAGAQNSYPEQLMPGQRTIMVSAGENDYPVSIGVCPFLL